MPRHFHRLLLACVLPIILGGCAQLRVAGEASSSVIASASVLAPAPILEELPKAPEPRAAIHAWKLLAWPMQSQSIRLDAPVDQARMAFLEKTLSPFDNIDERPSIGMIIATLGTNEDSESMRCQFEAYGLGTRRTPEQSTQYLKLRQEVGKVCHGVSGYPSDIELDQLDVKAGISAAQTAPRAKKR